MTGLVGADVFIQLSLAKIDLNMGQLSNLYAIQTFHMSYRVTLVFNLKAIFSEYITLKKDSVWMN